MFAAARLSSSSKVIVLEHHQCEHATGAPATRTSSTTTGDHPGLLARMPLATTGTNPWLVTRMPVGSFSNTTPSVHELKLKLYKLWPCPISCKDTVA